MAKNMALIASGVVSNILWCSDNEPETETMKDICDRPVGIGDIYAAGKWYRDGVEILTQIEAALAEVERLRAENADMKSALAILGVTADE